MIHQVSSELTTEGFLLRYQEREYRVSWPPGIWEQTPETVRHFLRDNLVYAMTMHLPMAVQGLTGLSYDTARPLLEPWFFQNFVRDIPSCADMEGSSAQEQTIRFLSREYHFTGEEIRDLQDVPAPGSTGPAGDPAPRAIVPMSFGKDSLLTFALAEELGLRPIIVYVVEPSFSNEERHKLALARAFERETGHKLLVINHETGALRGAEFGWGLQSTEYALLMLPFAWATGASLILFGNEQSAGSSYPDSSGLMTVYPCYDQSHHWTRMIDQITTLATGGRVRTGSVIEPLMDMMVQRILAHRYPRYARYQMSCFVEEEGEDSGGNHPDSPWCHSCGICAKMQLLCLASGIDPAAVGFRESMLTREKRALFPLLGGSSAFPYARTTLAREEQLFAFFCAVRLGSTEELVREFARGPLYREAFDRERELRSRFCTLYPPVSTPPALRRGVEHIFQNELEAYMSLYEGTRERTPEGIK